MFAKNNLSPGQNVLYWAFLIVAACGIFAYNVYLINVPFQITSGEGVPVLITRRLLEGVNPYLPEMMPIYANVYGILYNLLILPLASIFGPSLAFHRAVSAFAMIASVFVLYAGLRKVGGSPRISFGFALLMWAQYMVLLNPIARVDAVGCLFFVLALSLPHLGNFSKISFYLAAVFAIGGFFIKQYFFLPGLVLTVVSFAITGPVFSVILTSLMLISVVFLLAIFTYMFPTYIENSIFIGGNSYFFSLLHLIEQVGHIARENIFLCLGVLAVVIHGVRRNGLSWVSLPCLSGGRNWQVAAASWTLHHYHLAALGIMLPFALILQGWSNSYEGAYMIQLTMPFSFIVLVRYLTPSSSSILNATVALNLVWAMSAFPMAAWPDDRKIWAQWVDLISTKENIYAPQQLAIVLDNLGKPVYDAGLGHTYELSLQNSRIGNAWLTWHLKDFNERQHQMLAGKKFDLVIRPSVKDQAQLPLDISENYDLIRTLHLPNGGQYPIRIGKFEKHERLFDIFEPK